MIFTDLEGDIARDEAMSTVRPSGWDISLGSTPRYGRRTRVPDTQRDATVVQVNGNGFKTELGDWLNISKFARPAACPMPNVGDRVRLLIDKANFIRKVSVLTPASPMVKAEPDWLDAPATSTATEAAPARSSNVGTKNDVQAEPPTFVGRIEQDARGVVISRLACLNTATAILSSGGRATSETEVLALSAHLEAWATR